jgi:hypothetical protein
MNTIASYLPVGVEPPFFPSNEARCDSNASKRLEGACNELEKHIL